MADNQRSEIERSISAPAPLFTYGRTAILLPMLTKKVTGVRGSWFAEVDGEALPCVHKYWWSNGRYHDPFPNDDSKKEEEFVNAIREKQRVILTTDDVFDNGTKFKRTGYIALYKVANVQYDTVDGLRFDFKERLANLC